MCVSVCVCTLDDAEPSIKQTSHFKIVLVTDNCNELKFYTDFLYFFCQHLPALKIL